MYSIEFPARNCDLSPMAKGPQILTANRLTDGAVLYWRAGAWADGMAEAEIFDDPAAGKKALDAAARFVADRVVVNPYLFDVRMEDGVAVPVKERELVRAAGPTVRRDLGKQAQGQFKPAPVHTNVTHAASTPGKDKDPFDVSI